MMSSHYARAPTSAECENRGTGERFSRLGPISRARAPSAIERVGRSARSRANLFPCCANWTIRRQDDCVMPVPDRGLGEAINDRLARAAAPASSGSWACLIRPLCKDEEPQALRGARPRRDRAASLRRRGRWKGNLSFCFAARNRRGRAPSAFATRRNVHRSAGWQYGTGGGQIPTRARFWFRWRHEPDSLGRWKTTR